MWRKICQRQIGNSKDRIGLVADRIRDLSRRSLFSSKQAIPNFQNTAAERRHPSHARDAHAHSGNCWITMEAFVPPNPNEFETTVRSNAGRGSFATMLRSTSSSGVRKFIFAGRNWCRSERIQKTASIAPAAPNE